MSLVELPLPYCGLIVFCVLHDTYLGEKNSIQSDAVVVWVEITSQTYQSFLCHPMKQYADPLEKRIE